MAKRYHQMIPIIAALKPKTIIEVGVHRGKRAAMLCLEALRHSSQVNYAGFDVFDTLGEKFQADALNGKGTPTMAQAAASLEPVAMQYLRFSYGFTVGDTRHTLHGKSVTADFAFIDGDHRVDAIRGDYEALKDCPVVVFDDYYRAGPNGNLPDLSKYGANAVVDELIAQGKNVEILPTGDLCNHGAITYLAVVRR